MSQSGENLINESESDTATRRRVVGPAETCHECGDQTALIQDPVPESGNRTATWWCDDCYDKQDQEEVGDR